MIINNYRLLRLRHHRPRQRRRNGSSPQPRRSPPPHPHGPNPSHPLPRLRSQSQIHQAQRQSRRTTRIRGVGQKIRRTGRLIYLLCASFSVHLPFGGLRRHIRCLDSIVHGPRSLVFFAQLVSARSYSGGLHVMLYGWLFGWFDLKGFLVNRYIHGIGGTGGAVLS